MKRAGIVLAVIAGVVIYAALLMQVHRSALAHENDPSRSSSTTICMEDDPCWNCFTMGNHVCGPIRGK